MARAFEVEVAIRVEPERIWTALTRPDEITEWFGWDADTLEDEIQFIFLDHVTTDQTKLRIDFAETGGQYIQVAPAGGNSVIRVVQPGGHGSETGKGTATGGAGTGTGPGDGTDASSDNTDGPDPMEEGWIGFFHQLKRYLEDHHGDHRKTLYLTGSGPAAEISTAVSGKLPGEDWFRGTNTRVINTGDFGPGLGVLFTTAPLESGKEENATLTLSTWGLSEAEFFEVTSDWFGWWQGLVDGAEVVIAGG